MACGRFVPFEHRCQLGNVDGQLLDSLLELLVLLSEVLVLIIETLVLLSNILGEAGKILELELTGSAVGDAILGRGALPNPSYLRQTRLNKYHSQKEFTNTGLSNSYQDGIAHLQEITYSRANTAYHAHTW